jgi:hypothetical protein
VSAKVRLQRLRQFGSRQSYFFCPRVHECNYTPEAKVMSKKEGAHCAPPIPVNADDFA